MDSATKTRSANKQDQGMAVKRQSGGRKYTSSVKKLKSTDAGDVDTNTELSDHEMITMRAMRVTRCGGSEVLKLEIIPKPVPKDSEVLVKVHCAGISSDDTYIRGDSNSDRSLPFVAGVDAAGVVEAVGAGVQEFKIGDRVYLVACREGTYAEYVVAPACHVALLNNNLSYAQGASIGTPYYTAWKSLYIMAGARPGETVLIHGASGAVGVAATQFAIASGQRVFVTAGTKKGMELVKNFGAELVFSHADKGHMNKILKATGGKGVDVILEMLADVNLDKDLDILAFRGRVVVIGCRGNIEISPWKMYNESSIIGISIASTVDTREWIEMRAAVQAGLRAGYLVPVVGREYKLEDAAHIHSDVTVSCETVGNLVLNIT